jgi:1-acyl-sn-glycerol-3-phosphate acyltransferase
MRKALAYPLTLLYLLSFGICLVIFHPIQWICLRFFGYNAHRRSVSILNLFLMRCTHLLGTRYTFDNPYNLPADRPLIIVANHQSMNDIPPIIWFLRKYHPKFVSKKELGKGIPSVSFNLRHGGSVLIDRKDSKQAFAEILRLGKYIEEFKRSAVIFPEGTRSRTGQPKKFQQTGIKILLKAAPTAIIVPISINNSWKMHRYGKFPLGLGSHLIFQVHRPIENEGDVPGILSMVEAEINRGIMVNT